MSNVVLARIDDRLIHGQVIAKWAKKLFFKNIFVVDDAVSKDAFACRLMLAIAPKDLNVKILNVADATELLKADDETATCVITKNPMTFETLIENGVVLKEVQLGGMGSNSNRTSLVRNAAASQEERECMKRMCEKGIRVYYQDIPETKPTELEKLL